MMKTKSILTDIIPVIILFLIFLVEIEVANVFDSIITADGVSSINSCRYLSLRYKCKVIKDEEIVININTIVVYERPLCLITLKKNRFVQL